MMRLTLMVTVAALIQSYPVFAEIEKESAAKALAESAADYVRKNGVDTACKEFADPAKGFQKGEMYVFIQDLKAKMICNPANPRLNGKDLLELKDADNKYFNKEMLDLLKKSDGGWVGYRWVNPVSKNIEPKSTYVIGVSGVMLGVGIYQK